MMTLTASLVADGFKPHPPSHIDFRTARIDQEIVANAPCDRCGAIGLYYSAWHYGRAYRVVGKCKSCGHESEF